MRGAKKFLRLPLTSAGMDLVFKEWTEDKGVDQKQAAPCLVLLTLAEGSNQFIRKYLKIQFAKLIMVLKANALLIFSGEDAQP